MAKVFFSNQDIVLLTMAVYLGAVATDLFKAFTKDILVPLVAPLFIRTDVDDAKLKLNGYTLDIGDFLFQLANAIVAVVIAVVATKLLRRYGRGWLKHFYM